VAGNLIGLGAIKKVCLQDVTFPGSITRAHMGPRYGIEDARKILGVCGRPRWGPSSSPRWASIQPGRRQWQKAAVRGGLDLVKDDETFKDIFRE